MKRLIRVVKYMFATKDLELFFPNYRPTTKTNYLEVITDSDWAGETQHRKSSSCAVLQSGACTLTCISRGQGIRSQSSTEAEVYGAVMGVMEACHLQQLLAWLGEPLRLRLSLDSSAARSAVLRRGVGRIRHLEVKVLWIQDHTNSGRLVVDKIKGTENPADIGTKPLPGPTFVKLRAMLGLMMMKGLDGAAVGFPRAEATPGSSWLLYLMMMFVMILLLGACACGYRWGYQRGHAAGLTGRLKKSDEQRTRAMKTKKIMHDSEVQGPVRYMRHYETPRFVPTANDSWGSAVRATWVYETTGTTERKGPHPVD